MITKGGNLFLTKETVSPHTSACPQPNLTQILPVCEQRGLEVSTSGKTRVGRPATVRWNHVCLAIVPGFLRGWHAPWDVWRRLCRERLGTFAPVQVCDQAVSNRMEQAVIPLPWLVEQVRSWLRKRLARFSKIAVSLAFRHGDLCSCCQDAGPSVPLSAPLCVRCLRETHPCWVALSMPSLTCVCNNGYAWTAGDQRASTAQPLCLPCWSGCKQEQCSSLIVALSVLSSLAPSATGRSPGSVDTLIR